MGPPDKLDSEELEATFLEAKDAALRLLAYRARSEAEVERRLSRRYSPAVVERVIEALRQQRHLDDQAFARLWRRNREEHRPRSRGLVQQELSRLGVASEIVQEALDGFDNDENAYRAGLKQAQKLSARNYSEEDFRRKLRTHLQQRGFGYGIVRQTVDRLWQELRADALHCQDHAKDEEE
jgi:regulatory protein